MPFTISHIAIVLPFTCRPRKYLSVTGLMIGTMVPDFLYFILLNPYFDGGHTWWGIFVYDIPLALLLAFLYHDVAKSALIRYLPEWAGSRIHHFRYFNWDHYFKQHYFVVISSIILGALSHLFLDAFTHGDGYFVQLIPFLERNLTIFHQHLEMWYLMQYLSSITGLLLLVLFFLKIPALPLPADKQGRNKLVFWLLTVVIAGIILLINKQQPQLYEKSMDYLAIVMGGIFYGFCAVVLGKKLGAKQ